MSGLGPQASGNGLDTQRESESTENVGSKSRPNASAAKSISGGENQNTAFSRKGLWVTGGDTHMETAHKKSIRNGGA